MYLNIKSSPISSVVLILSSFASLSILIEGSSDKKGSTIIINGGGSGSDEYDYGHNVQIVPVPVPAAKPKIEFYEEHIMSPSYGYDDKSMSYEGNYGHGSYEIASKHDCYGSNKHDSHESNQYHGEHDPGRAYY